MEGEDKMKDISEEIKIQQAISLLKRNGYEVRKIGDDTCSKCGAKGSHFCTGQKLIDDSEYAKYMKQNYQDSNFKLS